MKKTRLTFTLILLTFLLVAVSNLSFGQPPRVMEESDPLEGTTWVSGTTTYIFKQKNKVTETREVDGEREQSEGTYTLKGDSVKMRFRGYDIIAKIEGDLMTGNRVMKYGTVGWSAKKK